MLKAHSILSVGNLFTDFKVGKRAVHLEKTEINGGIFELNDGKCGINNEKTPLSATNAVTTAAFLT